MKCKTLYISHIKGHSVYIASVVLSLLTSLIILGGYLKGADYVFGGSLSDSVRILYPTYYWWYETLFGKVPSLWSLQMGLGTSILSHSDIIFNPLTYILYLFGPEHIGDMFVWMQIAGMLLASLACCYYLGRFGVSAASRILMSCCYACCGWIVIFGSNAPWLTAFVYFPLFLAGIELVLRRSKVTLLATMSFLTVMYFYYFFWMFCIFGLGYAITRIFQLHIKNFRRIVLGFVAVLVPVLFAAVWVFPVVDLVFSGPRAGMEISPSALLTPNLPAAGAFLTRLLDLDALGMMGEYGGPLDYFNLSSYMGLLPIVLSGQILFNRRSKHCKPSILVLGCLIGTIIFPVVSWVMNGFSDLTYRWLFVWVPVICLAGAFGFDEIVQHGLRPGALAITLVLYAVVGLIAASSFPVVGAETISDRIARVVISIVECGCMAGVVGLFALMKNKVGGGCGFRAAILFAVIVLLMIGDVSLNYRNWPARDAWVADFSDMETEHRGFFDEDFSVVDQIKSKDKGLYRIEKAHGSVIVDQGIEYESDNDAMVQGYYGIHGYNSLNSAGTISFLQNAGVWVAFPSGDTSALEEMYGDPTKVDGQHLNYINGVGDRWDLMSLLGVKYYVTKSDDQIDLPSTFEKDESLSTDGRTVWVNRAAYPFAFLLRNQTHIEDYLSMDSNQKDLTLLTSVVSDDELNLLETEKISSIEDETVYEEMARHQEKLVDIVQRSQGSFSCLTHSDSDGVLVVSTAYEEDGWDVTVDDVRVDPLNVDLGLLGVEVPKGKHKVEIGYMPKSAQMGAFVSLGTLGIAGCYGLTKVFRSGKREQCHLIDLTKRNG